MNVRRKDKTIETVVPGQWIEIYYKYGREENLYFGVICEIRNLGAAGTTDQIAMVVMWGEKVRRCRPTGRNSTPPGQKVLQGAKLGPEDYVLQSWASIIHPDNVARAVMSEDLKPILQTTEVGDKKSKQVQLCSNIWYDRKLNVFKVRLIIPWF